MQNEALAVILGLAAAISWGLGSILVRLGQRYISTTLGTLVSLVAGVLFTWMLVLAFEREAAARLSGAAIGLFSVIGILNFPLGRFFNYMSIQHLGVGRATPILASSPLFAMVLAVAFAGESVDLATVAGTALILFGLYVTIKPPAAHMEAPRSATSEDAKTRVVP
ncbi:MAG: DMT family transporter [Chloroflexi bacterium]|nr:DMT family transporter [Chloroflexota bacterium]